MRETKRRRGGRREMKTQTFHQVQVWFWTKQVFFFFPLFNLQLTSLLSGTCKVNIWNYTWRFYMLISSVICASIKICRYNEAVSHGYVRTRGKETKRLRKKLVHCFTERKKKKNRSSRKKSEISNRVTEMSPTSPLLYASLN